MDVEGDLQAHNTKTIMRGCAGKDTGGASKVLQDRDYGWQVAGILSESCSIFVLLHATSHSRQTARTHQHTHIYEHGGKKAINVTVADSADCVYSWCRPSSP